ncbi:hypothetical protein Hanom_Chr06g00502621 [Helianthus anomalus]
MVKAINQVSFNYARLKANIAKYNNDNRKYKAEKGKVWHNKSKDLTNENKKQEYTRFQGETSQTQKFSINARGPSHWKDALLGIKRSNEPVGDGKVLHVHKEAETTNHWNQCAFVGRFKDFDGLKKANSLKEQVRRQGCIHRFVGGLNFLVSFNEKKLMLETLEGIKEGWGGELEELYV